MNYEQFKKEALEKEPLTYKVNISDIELISDQLIAVKGFQIPMKYTVLKDFAKLLKVPMSIMSTFDETIGKDGKMKFLNFIRTSLSTNKTMMVTLVANRETRSIIAVHTGDILPYEIYFRIFEDLMNKYPFEIKDLVIADEKISVSTILREKQFNVGGIDSENFYPGFTFSQGTNAGTALDSFIYRLVCSNGMIGRGNNDPIKFGPTNLVNYDAIAADFFNRIDKLAANGLMPASFVENVNRAQRTKASFAEVKTAAAIIQHTSPKVNDFIDSFIPVNVAKSQLSQRGVELSKLNSQQEKSIITNATVWDVVNGITDYASHDYGFAVSPDSKLKLQVTASGILCRKAYDTENTLNIN
ncbi:MAG: hypothetical protein PHC93_05855, partial [Candidatus Omnitrophica bacterium]|nr:hypothetical protein [Candidatus Omnitrophota bacterium]